MDKPRQLRDFRYLTHLLDTSAQRVRRLCHAGVIPYVRVGRRILFDPDQIEAWIKNGGRGLKPASAADR